MHPIHNIRGISGSGLKGKHVVLAVCGSIAVVKTVELARELARHGAEVTAVMTPAAQKLLHPNSLQFATGKPVVTTLTGDVEHVQLLGDVPEKADLLLVAPATADFLGKFALGLDDDPVLTCATVAVGTKTPIVIAPAMHEAMLDHPIVTQHAETIERMGLARLVAPKREEHKAKMAEIPAIVDACIRALQPYRGRALVVGGATAEPLDDVRILTNRSSGRTALELSRALLRHGFDVELWYGHATIPVPADLDVDVVPFRTHQELVDRAPDAQDFDAIWMPAAIADYTVEKREGKMASESDGEILQLQPTAKIAPLLQEASPDADLILFKAEPVGADLEAKARARLERYGARAVLANTTKGFESEDNEILLVQPHEVTELAGSKPHILAAAVDLLCA